MPQTAECRSDGARKRANLKLRRMTAVLPTSKTPRSAAPEARSGAIHVSSAGASAPLAPIGPERLKALREAIQDGSYPSDEHVLGGLERMFGVADARRGS
jgi:hypothetical protein